MWCILLYLVLWDTRPCICTCIVCLMVYFCILIKHDRLVFCRICCLFTAVSIIAAVTSAASLLILSTSCNCGTYVCVYLCVCPCVCACVHACERMRTRVHVQTPMHAIHTGVPTCHKVTGLANKSISTLLSSFNDKIWTNECTHFY
jgi:hypothetical protein